MLSLQSYMFGDTQEAVEAEAAGGEEDEEELGEVIRKTPILGIEVLGMLN